MGNARPPLFAAAVGAVVFGSAIHCASFGADDASGVGDAAPDVAREGPLPADASVEGADTAADGSPDSGLVGCLGQPDCERVVFVTSMAMMGGAIGGTAGGDALCNLAAATATHPRVRGRKFDAWLSTEASSVATRLKRGTRRYIRPDGVVVAKDWADLTDGAIAAAIEVDENGSSFASAAQKVWTGTKRDATTFNGSTCALWRNTTVSGEYGVTNASDATWTDAGNFDCNLDAHLYCIED